MSDVWWRYVTQKSEKAPVVCNRGRLICSGCKKAVDEGWIVQQKGQEPGRFLCRACHLGTVPGGRDEKEQPTE